MAERVDANIRINLEGEEELQDELTTIISKIAKRSNVPIRVRADNVDEVKSELNSLVSTIRGGKTRTNLGQFISKTDAAKLRQRIRRVTAEVDNLGEEGQRAMVKTSLASQEMIRIIQDAPFGLFGITNNIQAMFDQLANQSRRTGATMVEVFKKSFRGILTGPMAISALVAVITALALRTEELGEMLDSVKVKMNLLRAEQAALNAEMNKASNKSLDNFIEKLDDAQLEKLETQLKNSREVLEALEQRAAASSGAMLGLASSINAGTDEFDEMSQNMLNVIAESKAYDLALDNLEKDIRSTSNVSSDFKKELLDIVDSLREASEESERFAKIIEEGFSVRDFNLKDRGDSLSTEIEGITLEADQAIKKAREQFGDDSQLEQAIVEWRERAINLAKREDAKAQEEFKEARRRTLFGGAEFMQDELEQEDLDQVLREQFRQERQRAQTIMREEEAKARAKSSKEQAQVASILDPVAFEEAKIDAQIKQQERLIDARIRGLRRLHDIAGTDEATQRLLTAQISQLEADKTRAVAEGERRRSELRRKETKVALDTGEKMVSQLGATFGSLATIMAKSSKDGLEQNKNMLIAQATANAIASSIGVASSILTNPSIPFPLNVGLAATQGAAILTGLMAQVRQIRNAGSGGSTSGSLTGGFTQLNPNITGSRVANFEQQRRRRNIQDRSNERDRMTREMEKTRKAIQDQRVILDDPTAREAMDRVQSKNVTLNK